MRAAVLITVCWLIATGFPADAKGTSGGPFPAEDEKRLWDQALQEENRILQSGRVLKDDRLQGYLQGVVGHLWPPETPAHLRFRIVVIRSSRVDAVAYPTGLLCIHTGILARLDNEAQLATLLAHEMSHCILRHSIRALRGEPAGVTAAASGGGPGVESRPVSCPVPEYPLNFETEADRMALQLLLRAGYDGNEALKLFQTLLEDLEWDQMARSQRARVRAGIQKRQEVWRETLQDRIVNPGSGILNQEIFQSRVGTAIMANARLELQAGNFQEARRQLNRYLAFQRDDACAHFLLGEVFRQRAEPGDTQKAISCYQKAVALDPHLAEAHRKIGLMYYKGGSKELARAAFETALLLDPDSPDNAYILSYRNQWARSN